MKLYEYRVAFRGDLGTQRDAPPLITDVATTGDLDVAIVEHARHWFTSDYLVEWKIDPNDLIITVDRGNPWHDPVVCIDPTPFGPEPPIRRIRAEITSG